MITTKEERLLGFVRVMQAGWASGCITPIECYSYYDRSLISVIPFHKQGSALEYLNDCFCEFIRGTAGSPEEKEYLESATKEQLLDILFASKPEESK